MYVYIYYKNLTIEVLRDSRSLRAPIRYRRDRGLAQLHTHTYTQLHPRTRTRAHAHAIAHAHAHTHASPLAHTHAHTTTRKCLLVLRESALQGAKIGCVGFRAWGFGFGRTVVRKCLLLVVRSSAAQARSWEWDII